MEMFSFKLKWKHFEREKFKPSTMAAPESLTVPQPGTNDKVKKKEYRPWKGQVVRSTKFGCASTKDLGSDSQNQGKIWAW